jgi:hypothetical protein
MLTLMHEAEPYGELRDAGQPLEVADLVQLLGGTASEVKRLITELEGKQVFSRCDDGAIFSRRMKRDYLKAETDRENGRGGGNPSLKRQNNQPDIPPDNGGVNPQDKAHARAGAPDHFHIQSKKDSEAKASDAAVRVNGEGLPIRDRLWREGLPIIRDLTGLSESQARAFLGGLVKRAADDCSRVFRVVQEAGSLKPIDPKGWLTKAASPPPGHLPMPGIF